MQSQTTTSNLKIKGKRQKCDIVKSFCFEIQHWIAPILKEYHSEVVYNLLKGNC